jgi:sterol desaturase/sphingolipid hydroxylase (fatty acid hydroxylase superfamily)
MSNMSDTNERSAAGFEREWAYKPAVPIQVSPFFCWPPDPARMFKWIVQSWLTLTENVLLVAIASVSWFWFSPTLEEARTLAPGWIAGMYFRNLVLLLIVAGGLHMYFHAWKKQDEKLKFDARELRQSGKAFTFDNQVKDNMFWSLGSGVFFWTVYEALMFWSMANGYAPVLSWDSSPVWFIAAFALTPLWISFHFYGIHRWLH